MDIIEDIEGWRRRFSSWKPNGEELSDYPFVQNRRAPFTPARRALPMLNLALISSAGAYIDGTPPFDTSSATGDSSFKEIPIEVEDSDLRFAARGYDPAAVQQDANSQRAEARQRTVNKNTNAPHRLRSVELIADFTYVSVLVTSLVFGQSNRHHRCLF